ncbi:MAG TPA: prepilin peptidase [Pirellulales bacterium]|nr:prepilin peptidase [Pirellulales bacterium]
MDGITEWTLRLGWILPVWLFALGGTIGSFLNVVVYRLPAGKSIVHPGSQCPACGHPIRWYHNLPIVSWLLLAGRCHDCKAKISIRYPIVEAIAAILFLALFFADVWLPVHASSLQSAPTPPPNGWDLAARYLGDVWLGCTLLCAALIEIDGRRVPRRIFWLAIAVAAVVAAALPTARAGVILHVFRQDVAAPSIGALADLLVGAVAGSLVGLVIQAGLVKVENDRRAEDVMIPLGIDSLSISMASMGAFLGWAGAIVTGIAATILLLLMRRLSRRESRISRLGWNAFALVAALAWIVILPRFIAQ